MKVTEKTADTYKLSSLQNDLIVALGPIQFMWGDEPFEPEEIVVDFTREMSATFDVEIDRETADKLWYQITN